MIIQAAEQSHPDSSTDAPPESVGPPEQPQNEEGTKSEGRPLERATHADSPPNATSSPVAELTIEEMSAVAKATVTKIIERLLLEAGINASQVEFPEVAVLADASTSSYNLESNTIVIHPNHINSRSAYGEEIFHWLRYMVKPTAERSRFLNDLPTKEQFAVEEFFGFVGRFIVQGFCKDTLVERIDVSANMGFSEVTIDRHKLTAALLEKSIDVWSKGDFSRVEITFDYLRNLRDSLVANEYDQAAMHFLVLKSWIDLWREESGPSKQTGVPENRRERLLFFTELYCKQFPELLLQPRVSDPSYVSTEQWQQGHEAERTKWIEHLHVLISIFDQTMSTWDDRIKRLAHQKMSNDIHVPGYEAGSRFLTTNQDPKKSIFKLIKKPSLEVYLNHIFVNGLPEDNRTFFGGVFGSIQRQYELWVEKRRVQAEVKNERERLAIQKAWRRVYDMTSPIERGNYHE